MTNWNRLCVQIAESEVAYRVIKARAASLAALASRTPAQEAQLKDYQTKLDHDDAILGQWKQALRVAGVSLASPAALTARSNTLAALRERVQERLASLDAEVSRLQALRAASGEVREPDLEIEPASRAAQLQYWQERRLELVEQQETLAALEKGAPTW